MPVLSKDFNLDNYTYSWEGMQHHITEQFNLPEDIVKNIHKFHCEIVVPLLDLIPKGSQLRITNCYRCPKVNKLVGGSSTSDHLIGAAGDLELWLGKTESNAQLFSIILTSKLKYKQLIKEKGTDLKPSWIHIAYVEKDLRMQVIRIK